MDPKKVSAEWFRTTVFKDESIRPRAPRPPERVPSVLRAARSLANGAHQSWQSREIVFLKQAKLLAGYEDDYDFRGSVACYYPTYQSLTDQQLRGYFSWRTRLRHGEVCQTSLSFAFLYIYELINQVGTIDPMDGYRKLEAFRDAYGQLDGGILPYLERWLPDYVVYYGLDQELLADSPLAVLDRCAAVLEQVREQDQESVICAVGQLSKWLGRSKFYATCWEDMDAVIVRVLRRVSDHYAVRCKKTMVEQYFGSYCWEPAQLFDAAVFCNPLKRRNYRYAAGGQCVYACNNGHWVVWKRAGSKNANGGLDALLKTIDSVMRQEYGYGHPVKAEQSAKWVLKIIQEEVQGLLARKKAAEEAKVVIDYAQLTKIRQDADITREKLIVDEEADLPEEPAPREEEQLSLLAPPEAEQAPAPPPAAPVNDSPLDPAEYRLLQCLLYGGDTGWVQSEGLLLSVLADGVNEKLYDTFLDTVLDDTPHLIEDYIDDLKEMVHP